MPGKKRFSKNKQKGLSNSQIKLMRKIARDEAMEVPEKKNFLWVDENKQLIHNKSVYIANFLSCKQGVTDPNSTPGTNLVRIGDEFYLYNINIRLYLANKYDRPNVTYKAFLFWYDSDMTLSDSAVYFTQQNKLLDRINNESISLLDQVIVKSTNNYAGPTEKEKTYLATLNKSWKGRKVTYDEGATIPKNRTLGMAIVCYDSYGTLQTDNIASYAYNCQITMSDP